MTDVNLKPTINKVVIIIIENTQIKKLDKKLLVEKSQIF